ncbi:hypothetical protein DV736_g1896, partial [Chaetothyriales sp. CBS 134916]
MSLSWLWGGSKKADDPTASLDPGLKKVLDDQKSGPYSPAAVTSQTTYHSTTTTDTTDTAAPTDAPRVPRESLFQDGRYAHLWKTYIPLADSELTASTQSPVSRIVAQKKERTSGINRAALENCAFEAQLQLNCLGLGAGATVRSKLNVCRDETKTYNRCLLLQSRFLQALGYMADLRATEEQEEKIQMHADKLYHRMMDYEAEVDEAQRNGQPIPALTSLFYPDRPPPSLEDINLPPTVTSKLPSPLEHLPPHERELTTKAALAERQFADSRADNFFAATTSMNADRSRRQAWLVKTFGEPIGKFLIPDAPEDPIPHDTGPTTEELERQIWKTEGSGPKR